jgi:hypothetical protein
MAHSGDSAGQGSRGRSLIATTAVAAFILVSFALVGLIFFFLHQALSQLFGGHSASFPRALLLSFVVIAVGMLIGVLSLLLRFAERERYDGRPPPSLVPALIIVALGVALGCVSALH